MKITLLLFGTLCWIASANSELSHPHHEAIEKHSEGESHHSGDHHDAVKHIKKSGKSSKHDEESSAKGHSGQVNHKKIDLEEHGKKSIGYDEGSHSKHESNGGGSNYGAHMRDGAKHKKTHSTKGYREQYHKHEHKNHDSYYSNGHKSGSWKKYGMGGSKYQSHKHDKEEHGKKITLKSGDKYGKASKKSTDHKFDDHKGHKLDKAKKSGFGKYDKWGKSSQQKSQNKHKYKYTPETKYE